MCGNETNNPSRLNDTGNTPYCPTCNCVLNTSYELK